jgi:Ni,Fe-hydrogenase III large subunit
VLAELERIRSNLAALAQVVEDLRTKHNTHTHGGAVAAPPVGEQSTIAYTMH